MTIRRNALEIKDFFTTTVRRVLLTDLVLLLFL